MTSPLRDVAPLTYNKLSVNEVLPLCACPTKTTVRLCLTSMILSPFHELKQIIYRKKYDPSRHQKKHAGRRHPPRFLLYILYVFPSLSSHFLEIAEAKINLLTLSGYKLANSIAVNPPAETP